MYWQTNASVNTREKIVHCRNSAITWKCVLLASYHVWTLFEPGECKWRVSSPFAVEADVRVNINCFWLRLHQQDWTDWRKKERESTLLCLSSNAVGLRGRLCSEKKKNKKHNNGVFHPSDSILWWVKWATSDWIRWDEYYVTHSEHPPGCWRWSFQQRWKPDRRRARWRRSGQPWWWKHSPWHPAAPHHP